jgi:hypothetical protein
MGCQFANAGQIIIARDTWSRSGNGSRLSSTASHFDKALG